MRTILQTEASECGLACLVMIASHFEHHLELHEVRRRFSVSLKGATLAQIIRHAEKLDFTARPLRLSLDELWEVKLPCILHWNLNHFVVLKKVRSNRFGKKTVTIIDPAVGERVLELAEVSSCFTGVALELTPSPRFQKSDETYPLKLTELTGPIIGMRRSIAKILMLAFALELMGILFPQVNQFIIDDIIANGDSELLQVILIGFCLLLAIQYGLGYFRARLLLFWSSDLSIQWSNRLMSHLLSLPIDFFEKRHLGDVISRFGSITAIQSTVTSLFLEGLIDGCMAIIALGLMLLYDVGLTLFVLACVACYLLLRLYFHSPLKQASQEKLILSAREGGHLIETVRAISPIKLFGRESERRVHWLNLKMHTMNRDIKTQKMLITMRISASCLNSLQGLGIFYIGAGLIMSGAMTIGMLLAFSGYAMTFAGRANHLIDLIASSRILGIHMLRLADIVREEPERDKGTDISSEEGQVVSGDLELRDVWFRYAEGEPWILRGINAKIAKGESVAIVGPSGGGKSTLCKLLLGALTPSRGEILINGRTIDSVGVRSYRRAVGSVMQDDVLLAGSILENISFFGAHADFERAKNCARIAEIHDEISSFPMGYQTLLGDSGSVLSGGQRQRILLARALYKEPMLLILDEATSHLDVSNEEKVSAKLASMSVTRIIVAHRPETYRTADRQLNLTSGVLF